MSFYATSDEISVGARASMPLFLSVSLYRDYGCSKIRAKVSATNSEARSPKMRQFCPSSLSNIFKDCVKMSKVDIFCGRFDWPVAVENWDFSSSWPPLVPLSVSSVLSAHYSMLNIWQKLRLANGWKSRAVRMIKSRFLTSFVALPVWADDLEGPLVNSLVLRGSIACLMRKRELW